MTNIPTLADKKENVAVACKTLARQWETHDKSDNRGMTPPRYLFSQQTYVIAEQAAYIAALESKIAEYEVTK